MATIKIGDCIESMRGMDAGSVHCCVTSPPYWGLRDYGNDGQIGLEDTPDAYVARLVEVFREVRRVLRDDGTLWLNLGDSYAVRPQGRSAEYVARTGGNTGLNSGNARTHETGGLAGLKPKDLVGIPWRVAFALQADGWYLRSDIIWHKPNPMPESVTDRPTKAHEYMFLLTKSARYYYDADAVREALCAESLDMIDRSKRDPVAVDFNKMHGNMDRNDRAGNLAGGGTGARASRGAAMNPLGRNRRSVWTIATRPFSGAHFAVMPPALVEPCALAGCPETVCAACGAPVVRVVERTPMEIRRSDRGAKLGKFGATAATCDCNADTIGGTVLDPFGGSGTVAVVAMQHHRQAIICELSPDYAEIARQRIASEGRPAMRGKIPRPPKTDERQGALL